MDTIKSVLALAARQSWIVHQMDVKHAFLNGYIDEEVYVSQPKSFEMPSKEHYVYKVKKALYGLKKTPRAWYSRIDSYLP